MRVPVGERVRTHPVIGGSEVASPVYCDASVGQYLYHQRHSLLDVLVHEAVVHDIVLLYPYVLMIAC